MGRNLVSTIFSKNRFIKVIKSRHIALFVFSGSIRKLFSVDCVNIYLFSISFSIEFSWWKNVELPHIAYMWSYLTLLTRGVTSHCLYRDSLTLIST